MIKKMIKALFSLLMRPVPISLFRKMLLILIQCKLDKLSPKDGLKFVLGLDNALYNMSAYLAVEYGKGNHVKHRLTSYYEYFCEYALKFNGPYLDIGCGNGDLSFKLAEKTDARVTGIDIEAWRVENAQSRYTRDNLEFVMGDATKITLDGQYPTLILSNVLEHIDDRVSFLKELQQKYQPQTLLIRVPNFERDWRVPLKKELEIEWRTDDTHFTEHTMQEFKQELEAANIEIISIEVRWGEIWSILKPSNN